MNYKLLSYTATAGNADASFTVPYGKEYRVLYGQVKLTTDATVASRRVQVQVLDATDAVVFYFHAGTTIPASQTSQQMCFMQGVTRETALIGGSLSVPIGHDFVIPPGYTLNIHVDAGVAGDSHVGQFMIEEK